MISLSVKVSFPNLGAHREGSEPPRWVFLMGSSQVLTSFVVYVEAVGLCGGECRKLHRSNVRPLKEHIEVVQSLKPMENPHWLLDYPFTGFLMVSSCALNSTNVAIQKRANVSITSSLITSMQILFSRVQTCYFKSR